MLAARQRHVTDHVKCGGQHFRHHLGLAAAGCQPRRGPFGGGGHGGGQCHHVAMGEDRRHRLALPFPVGAIGIEQAVADRRPQHAAHHLGLGIIGQIVVHHPAITARIGQHVPAQQHLARHDGLAIGQCRDDLQHIAPCGQGGFQPAQDPGVDRGTNGNKGFAHNPMLPAKGRPAAKSVPFCRKIASVPASQQTRRPPWAPAT